MQGSTIRVKQHQWHLMAHAPVEIMGLDSAGDPAVFRVGEQVEGIACMDCSEPLEKDLSNQRTECIPIEEEENT